MTGIVWNPPPQERHPFSSQQPPPWRRAALRATLRGSGLLVAVYWAASDGLTQLLMGSWADRLHSVARLTGLEAGLLLALIVAVMARVPFVEKAHGQGGLIALHRRLGTLLLILVTIHVAAHIAASCYQSLGESKLELLNPRMFMALTSAVALFLIAGSTWGRLRARAYERWHLVHLLVYPALMLSVPHELARTTLGSTTTARVLWVAAAVGALALVLVYRLGLPLYRSWRYDLYVADVIIETETPNLVTLLIRSRTGNLAGLGFQAGQYGVWRFLRGKSCLVGHPYSLSGAPDDNELRITILARNGISEHLCLLNARVLVEGPYGVTTPQIRTRRTVAFLAEETGVTPLLALLEAMDLHPTEAVFIHRVLVAEEAPLRSRLETATADLGAGPYYIEGHTRGGRDQSWLPTRLQHLSDVQALLQLLPDAPDRDLFICGSRRWSTAMENAVLAAGVHPHHVHVERFDRR